MRKLTLAIIAVLLISGCAGMHKPEDHNNAEYGPMAIRLSEFSNQVIYYYQGKKQAIPTDFDASKFVGILRQLPPDQVSKKDVDSMVSMSVVKAHVVGAGFSVMLCDENGRKLMEDFASPHHSDCRFDLNRVEIQSWNENKPCSFEDNWKQYCQKHE
jgi:hypothetical protein